MQNKGVAGTGEGHEPAALVCTLPQDALAERRSTIQTVLQRRTASRLSPDGLELDFAISAAMAGVLLEFILYEQACCKTFTYELCFLPPHEVVTLRLRAPAGQVTQLQAFYHAVAGERP